MVSKAKVRKFVRKHPMPQNFQGVEVTATLQAPNKPRMMRLLRSLKTYAAKQHMDDVKVLSVAKDPDGGWKAVIEAHNWNPMTWYNLSMEPINLEGSPSLSQDSPNNRLFGSPDNTSPWQTPRMV